MRRRRGRGRSGTATVFRVMRDARCACSVKPAGGEYYYTDAIVASDARDECGHPMFLVDAEFIAHARADVPALIAEVRKSQDELRRAHRAVSEMSRYLPEPLLDEISRQLNGLPD